MTRVGGRPRCGRVGGRRDRRGNLVVFVLAVFSAAIRGVTEYERWVFFGLGHVRRQAKGPGVIVRTPVVDGS